MLYIDFGEKIKITEKSQFFWKKHWINVCDEF